MNKVILGGGVVAIAAVAVFFYASHYMRAPVSSVIPFTKQIQVGSTTIVVEIVDTEAAREQGLSSRASLVPGSGMLFVFQQNGDWGIWMKDMQFPIDILFISENGSIVSINANVSPDTYPEVFYPPLAVRYVLELPAGFAAAHNIVEDTKLDLSSI